MSLLECALALARRGLPVFPLQTIIMFAPGQYACGCASLRCKNAGKHPMSRLAPSGLLNASISENVVRHWWTSAPTANIGLRTGSVIVLDVDPRHGGGEALAALEAQHGALPTSWRAITGGGGEHIYFDSPDTEIRNSVGLLGPGLDIRGVGGYVVAPPSSHISGRRYEWSVDHSPEDVPLAPMPAWLLDQLSRVWVIDRGRPASEWRALVSDEVTEGRRNNAIAKVCGYLLRRYVHPELALELLQAWNTSRCSPPLSSEEVTKTVGSIARKELKRREARDERRG